MGTVTSNISIYIPAAGETNYDQSFSAGMVNIDQHDHSGGPNKGVLLTALSIAPGAITYKQLNSDVIDTTTGLQFNPALLNQIQLAPIFSSMYQIPFATNGYLIKNGSTTSTTTDFNSTTQPSFNYSCQPGTQNNVMGDSATYYTVKFVTETFQQGSSFDGTSTFTAPSTGIYIFNVQLHITGFTTDCITNIDFVVTGTSANTYTTNWLNPYPIMTTIGVSTDDIILSGSQIMELTATDTVVVKAKADQSSPNSITITGGFFSGYELC